MSLFPSLYYRVVVITAPLHGLCYTVRDAIGEILLPQDGSRKVPTTAPCIYLTHYCAYRNALGVVALQKEINHQDGYHRYGNGRHLYRFLRQPVCIRPGHAGDGIHRACGGQQVAQIDLQHLQLIGVGVQKAIKILIPVGDAVEHGHGCQDGAQIGKMMRNSTMKGLAPSL